ncbi:hypothetical protein CK203_089671 [Vitis vinifera]|uniref:Retrotransposon gag domain-containing protein n=1 Tax=Vitis vinifera TaxID=29760 RepID=A0A438EHU6_VITVI|nr:hypothetical protein CK203_089671 [Vitis vinifera]
MVPSHRKKTVGKRTTTTDSPPRDRKVKRRKRGTTHPGFVDGASPSLAFKRLGSKLKARARVNIPWDSRSHPRSIQPKRQRDKRPQLSNSMRAKLGPQEPRRPRPPTATTWEAHPDPMVTPMVQNVLPHRDPMVTPMVQNIQPHLTVQQSGRNLPNEPPIGSISKRLDDMLSTPFYSHIIYYEPPRGFLATTCCYAKYFPSAYKGRPSHGFIAYLPTLLVISETYQRPSWDNTCAPLDISRTSALCQNIKMQDNESLREFVKRFGQVILQVEAYNMDVVLQIFKRRICPSTPFFESLAKKPPTTMDNLFRHANKYSMLEYDVSEQPPSKSWLRGQTSKSGAGSSAKLPDQPRSSVQSQEGPSRPERPPSHPFPYPMRSFSL